MDCTWDDDKARINLVMHGVSFDEAQRVLVDPHVLIEDDWSEPSEQRLRAIGLSVGRVLFVVFVEIDEDFVRLISARKANRHEQDRYYRQALP